MKFFLFILILVSSIANANEFKYLQSESYWTVRPAVFVCSDTNINIDLVKEAIKFWIDNGFNIDPNPSYKDCDRPISFGQITIDYFEEGDNPKNLNGRTREWSYIGKNELLEVEIKIKPSLENEIDLIKHELGHALGLDDDRTGKAVVMRHARNY